MTTLPALTDEQYQRLRDTLGFIGANQLHFAAKNYPEQADHEDMGRLVDAAEALAAVRALGNSRLACEWLMWALEKTTQPALAEKG
jgi:hypothetical protein